MTKGKMESSAWREIERRTGPSVILDGERVRPNYLGSLAELNGGQQPLKRSDPKSKDTGENGASQP